MKKFTKTTLALTLAIFAIITNGVVQAEDYNIGAGDLLSITVFDEPDMSLKKIRVSGAGMVSVPLLGEIKVSGLTSKQLEERLTSLLLDGYLKKPKVTVAILQYRLFYVHGEVNKPGGYPYLDGLTVQKAVALASGFTERASEKRIMLIREANSKKKEIKVNLNSSVNPGDVITVGESIF